MKSMVRGLFQSRSLAQPSSASAVAKPVPAVGMHNMTAVRRQRTPTPTSLQHRYCVPYVASRRSVCTLQPRAKSQQGSSPIMQRFRELPGSRRWVMLKGVPSCLDPEILKTLGEMGHGDTLVIADANFPSASVGLTVHRADGVSATDMLAAILKLVPLDSFVPMPVMVMQKVDDPKTDAPIVAEFQRLCDESEKRPVKIERVERFKFYERAEEAYAVIATGERRLYGNVIIKKGVIKPDE